MPCERGAPSCTWRRGATSAELRPQERNAQLRLAQVRSAQLGLAEVKSAQLRLEESRAKLCPVRDERQAAPGGEECLAPCTFVSYTLQPFPHSCWPSS